MSWYIDEIERMNRLIRDVHEHPLQKFMQDMERQRELMEPPGYRAFLELQESVSAEARRTQDMLTSAFSGVLGQHTLLQAIRTDFEYSNRFAAEAQKALSVFQPPSFPVIESLVDSLRHAAGSAELLLQFEQTFGGKLLDHAQAVADAPDNDFDQRIDRLALLLNEHITRSKKGPVSSEGYLQIILAVAFFIQSVISAHRAEIETRSHFEKIEAQLRHLAPIAHVQRESDLRLVSAKTLRVRQEPTTESPMVAKVTRNALVRVLGEDSAWARIEYFDFLHGEVRTGWVARRYLRQLPSDHDEFVAEASRRVLENTEW